MSRNYTIKSFEVDENLMYLIQKASGHSTEQILSYFNRMCTGVIETYLNKKALPSYARKELLWHYEGLDYVPYKLSMRSSTTVAQNILWYVSVNFPPKARSDVDMAEAMNSLIETTIGLEGAEPMAPFPKPRTRVPAGFKKFIHD